MAKGHGDQTKQNAKNKKATESKQISHLAVYRDKTDFICQPLYFAFLAADLQDIAFGEHDIQIHRHFYLRTNDSVKEAAVFRKIKIGETFSRNAVTFYHDLFF
ncbi:Uncharacterised protein [Vibrio cholerae]|uniref:Uncharacterized protein n=1 Tax=Vibrio cholerae TaxID=666 RepID=A0A655SCC8_VIBCL|nr:Uncharacterised protein [Vibrio cholerae]CSC99621.1 Uncharacterised protein [Vibrio cholerae]